MITVAQVLEEYRERRDSTAFKSIKIMEDCGATSEYTNVTGVHTTKDKAGLWLEFDYDSFTHEKKMHVKVHGHIIKTIQASE